MLSDLGISRTDFPRSWSPPTVLLRHSPPRAAEPGPLPPAGPLTLGSVELGPGRPVVRRDQPESPPPRIWVTDAAVPDVASAWSAAVEQFPSTGLWPVRVRPPDDESGRPWDGPTDRAPEAAIDALDPHQVLEEAWHGWLVPINNPWAPGEGPLAPFGPGFPGLAPAQPSAGESPVIFPEGSGHLGLVSCRRAADAVAVSGWSGAINRITAPEVSAVLRSWEDRFGAVLAGLDSCVLTLLIARPPASPDDALRVAAEIAALCPDALWQPESQPSHWERDTTLAAVSRYVACEPVWRLWFD